MKRSFMIRLAVALFLFVFSCACIFAQEDTVTNENGDKEAVEETENSEIIPPVLEEPNTAPEEIKSVNEEKNKAATSYALNLPWEYIIATAILLVVIALFLISHLSLRKLIRAETANLKKDVDETIKNIEKQYNAQSNSIASIPRYSSNTEDIRDIRDTIATLEKNISGLRSEISILRELKSKVDELYSGKRLTEGIVSGKLDVTEAFNVWAGNPVGPLPDAFYYIDGEINIRTKREIKESADGKWISNRNGTKKYLFPNPNSFNQMTNIPELYTMDQSKLKGKGQNKIRIIIPCEMTKDGFVEFAGELELL